MSILIAYDSMGKGLDMSGTTTGGGFLFNDSSISTTYLGALDSDTIAFSVSGAGSVRYFVVSGTVNTYTGDAILSELIYGDINANPLISWTNANLYVNLLDDFSSGITYTLLNTADYIYGNKYSDYIKAGAGNDFVFGYAENDTLLGESGNDTLDGGGGDDLLNGGAGNDLLKGGAGYDRYEITELTGGNDTITDTAGTTDTVIWNSSNANTYVDVSRSGTSMLIQVSQDGVLKQTTTVTGQFATSTTSTTPETAIERVYLPDDDLVLYATNKLTGTTNNDLIVGTSSADSISGDAGTDFMYGGAGNDTLDGGGGDDLLNGGAGNDLLKGGAGYDRYEITELTGGNDTITDTAGTTDTVIWNSSNANTYVDVSRSGTSMLIQVSQDGVLKQTTTVTGQFATSTTSTTPETAIERVYLPDDDLVLYATNKLTGTTNNDLIVGTSSADSISGDAGTDFMYGGAGNDTLDGGGGDDLLNGGAGNDLLKGGAGYDRYEITELTGGNDTITDTAGTTDTVIWNSSNANTYVDVSRSGTSMLIQVSQDGVLKQTTTVTGQFATSTTSTTPETAIERVYLPDDDLVLYATNKLTGTTNNDLIVGTSSADSISGDAGTDFMYGGAGNDTLDGGGGDDLLNGGAGNDLLKGGAGYDRYEITELTGGNDTITDTAGTTDTVIWNSSNANTYVDVSRSGTSMLIQVSQDGVLKQTTTVTGQFATSTTSTTPETAIERVYLPDDDLVLYATNKLTGTTNNDLIVGTSSADSISGDAGTDFMYGGAGNDTLDGGGGDDLLNGGAGNDLLKGGAGYDRYEITELTGGNDTITDTAGTTDTVIWNSSNANTYVDVSRSGTSMLIQVSQDGVLKQTTTVTGQFATSTTSTTPETAIERVYLPDDDLVLYATNKLTGTTNNDLIVGTSSADSISGDAGTDFMYGGAGNDTLDGGGGDDLLNGGAGNDLLKGGAGYDRYEITELTGGNDTITDTAGTTDTVIWNSSNANTYVDVSRSGTSMLIQVSQDGVLKQTTTVTGQFATSTTSTTPETAIERVYLPDDDLVLYATNKLTGTTNNDLIVGTSSADSISGDAGTDFMYGGAGNDTLDGGGGDDLLNGGAGNDLLKGGAGYDRYEITELTGGNDTITDTAGTTDTVIWNSSNANTYVDVSRSGTSMLIQVSQDGVLKQTTTVTGQFATSTTSTTPETAIERVYLPDDDLVLYATNKLTGTTNNDLIVGTSSADSISGDAGTDFMYGGAGNDTLDGGGGDDLLNGGAGNDLLKGGAGSDELNGGAGNDVLTGGTGVDYFDFTTTLSSTNVDTIADFNRADDFIRLDNAVMTGLGATTEALIAAAFVSGAGRTTAADASDRIIYNTSTGDLYYDADGTGSSAAVKIALIGTSIHPALDHTDFLII